MDEKRNVVLLDRDGVLNADSPDYIKTTDELEVFDFAPEAVSKLRRNGYLIYIVSNQSALARGLTDEATLGHITEKLVAAIGPVDGIFYCPHHPDDACDCRKPEPGLLRQAIANAEQKYDIGEIWMVGDSPKDIEAGKAVGARTILVLSGHTKLDKAKKITLAPDFVCEDLQNAVGIIVPNSK